MLLQHDNKIKMSRRFLTSEVCERRLLVKFMWWASDIHRSELGREPGSRRHGLDHCMQGEQGSTALSTFSDKKNMYLNIGKENSDSQIALIF